MSDTPVDSPRAAHDAFLEAYRQDLAAGEVRTLDDYKRQFPGHEESVAEEWAWLEPASATGVEPRADSADVQHSIGPYRIIPPRGS